MNVYSGDKYIQLVLVFDLYRLEFRAVFIRNWIVPRSSRMPTFLKSLVQREGKPIPIDSTPFSANIGADKAVTVGRIVPYP